MPRGLRPTSPRRGAACRLLLVLFVFVRHTCAVEGKFSRTCAPLFTFFSNWPMSNNAQFSFFVCMRLAPSVCLHASGQTVGFGLVNCIVDTLEWGPMTNIALDVCRCLQCLLKSLIVAFIYFLFFLTNITNCQCEITHCTAQNPCCICELDKK